MEPVKLPKFTSGRRDLNSPAEADIHHVAERHLRMGGGRSEGANPGPPYNDTFSELMAACCERVMSPVPQKQSSTEIRCYGFCWGLVED